MKFFALAATLSVCLAWKQGRTPTGLLEVSAVKAADTAQEKTGDCHKYNCSHGWYPKPGHFDLIGNGDEECCVKTCALWTCSHGFTNNTNYSGNLGESDERCCDALCKTYGCPTNFSVPDDKKFKVGFTTEACCEQICALTVCTTPKVKPTDPLKLAKTGHTQEDCCDDTCTSFVCPAGKVLDPNSLTEPAANSQKFSGGPCCVDTCNEVVGHCLSVTGGKEGYEVPPGKMTELAGENRSHCCVETCENHQCNSSNGWHEYPGTKPHCYTQPCSDQQCCGTNCRLHECGHGLKKDTAKGDRFPATDDTCCVKTCKLHTCGDNYVPDSNFLRNDTVGDTHEVCCDKWCNTHTCSAVHLRLVPDAEKVPGSTDAFCCEDVRCPTFRNLTKTEHRGCDSLSASKDDCENAYTELQNFQDGGFDRISCKWDATFGVCKVGTDLQPAHCGGKASSEAYWKLQLEDANRQTSGSTL